MRLDGSSRPQNLDGYFWWDAYRRRRLNWSNDPEIAGALGITIIGDHREEYHAH